MLKHSKEIVYIDRKKLLKLLYHPVTKIKGLKREEVDRACEKYPMLEKIISLVDSFKIALKTRRIDCFENLIESATELNIDAVKNAVIYDYNNVLAEGKVNKVKVTKRIMYCFSATQLLDF